MEDPIRRHPTRAEQLDILATLVADMASVGDAVLDLGCGTGYVAHLVLGRRPDLRFVGVDLKPESLAEADGNLAGLGADVTLVAGDLGAPDRLDVPPGPYRFVWSALTFHDLDDDAKARLIAWAAARLAPGGWWLLYDRVRLVEPALFPLQRSIWNRIERVLGAPMRTADDWDAYVRDLGTGNRPGALADYFDWFRAAGLAPAVLHLHGNVTLIGAAAPAAD